MLSPTKLNFLQDFSIQATKDELIYAKGFIDGLLQNLNISGFQATTTSQQQIAVKPLIVYATETGNSKKLATELLSNFKKEKIQGKSIDISQFNVAKLQKETLVLFVISTQGEGELPEVALNFYNELTESQADLNQLEFAVFGLGDSSYPLFCNAGILLDEALASKGATRILPLVKADVDFKPEAKTWEEQLKSAFSQSPKNETVTAIVPALINHKKNYQGQIKHKIILNDKGSNKETYHIEITSDDDVRYVPGDALGIVPKNNESDILAVLSKFNIESNELFNYKNEQKSALAWLEILNIKGLSKKSLDEISTLLNSENSENKADLIDVLNKLSENGSAEKLQQIIHVLFPVTPRLYSISSSHEAHDGEVHLTVNLHTFNTNGQEKAGFASKYLADLPVNETFDFYIHTNNNFRLPTENQDIIMIGPGTGIAPFRSFLAERDATGAEGKNWLFFGEQHFALDFYYQTEIQEWLATGLLTKLDTAFSRDQKVKIYVQDRIKQKAKDFNDWLQNGASIYVCGQKNPMSKDVENAIIEVISQERNISVDEAKNILEELENQGKYLKDVY
jgi:sulfite reductase (NADPH) flavoprotein alpha-component